MSLLVSDLLLPRIFCFIIFNAESRLQVGFPLVTLLLCLGDSHTFNTNFSQHLEILYKYLKVIYATFELITRTRLSCHNILQINILFCSFCLYIEISVYETYILPLCCMKHSSD